LKICCQLRKAIIHKYDVGFRVFDDELELGCGEAPIQRQTGGTHPPCTGEDLQHIRRIHVQKTDTVTWFDTQRGQMRRHAAHAVVHLAIGKASTTGQVH